MISSRPLIGLPSLPPHSEGAGYDKFQNLQYNKYKTTKMCNQRPPHQKTGNWSTIWLVIFSSYQIHLIHFLRKKIYFFSSFKWTLKIKLSKQQKYWIVEEFCIFWCRDFAFTFAIIASKKKIWDTLLHMWHVICHMSHVMCYMLHVTGKVSCIFDKKSQSVSNKKLHRGDKHTYTQTQKHKNKKINL